MLVENGWLRVQQYPDQAAPIAQRCLAVSSDWARCVLRFPRTHSLRLSAMTRDGKSIRSHFAGQKSQMPETVAPAAIHVTDIA